MRAVVALKSGEFTRELVLPLLSKVGELWVSEAICPVHEHILSVNLRRVLAWMIDSLPVDESAPVIVCTTPAHQRHELGAMLAGIAAAEERWRVAYIGPDLPAEDIAIGAKLTEASVVALSVVYVRDKDALRKEIRKIRAALPRGVMLVAGGSGAQNAGLEKAGAIVLPGFDELLALLRTRDTRKSA
jgi:methanogenic corrinoid protein MtbC1